jgi:hypothetical protein
LRGPPAAQQNLARPRHPCPTGPREKERHGHPTILCSRRAGSRRRHPRRLRSILRRLRAPSPTPAPPHRRRRPRRAGAPGPPRRLRHSRLRRPRPGGRTPRRPPGHRPAARRAAGDQPPDAHPPEPRLGRRLFLRPVLHGAPRPAHHPLLPRHGVPRQGRRTAGASRSGRMWTRTGWSFSASASR